MQQSYDILEYGEVLDEKDIVNAVVQNQIVGQSDK